MAEKPYFDRRSVISGVSAVVLGGLAGCSGGTESTGDSGGNDGGDGGDGRQTPDSVATETEMGTERPTETATPASSIDLAVSDATVTTMETAVGEDIVGEATVTNNGDTQTDSFVLGLDWLDESGEYIATTDVYGIFLNAGQTWLARSPAWLDVDKPERIESVEAAITEMDPWGELVPNPDGLELVKQNVRAGGDEVVVRGQIKNNRDTKTFIEAAGKITDSDGNVLATATTIEEVQSGQTWRFEMNPQTTGRNDRVDSGTVIPFISKA